MAQVFAGTITTKSFTCFNAATAAIATVPTDPTFSNANALLAEVVNLVCRAESGHSLRFS